MGNTNVNPSDLKSLVIWDREYKTTLTKKFENRKTWKPFDPKKVHSFIPGTIRKIMVEPGKEVKKGEPMLILESMKMMNVIRVPVDGKVKAVNVTIGEKVPKDHLMIEFE